MILEAMALKKIAENFPWRWVAIGLVAVLVGTSGWYAVYSYRQEVAARVTAESNLQEEQARLVTARVENIRLHSNIDRLKWYMAATEKRREQREAELRQIATRRTKRDEAGNIAIDDGLLVDLNGLYPVSAAAGIVQAGYSSGTAVSR